MDHTNLKDYFNYIFPSLLNFSFYNDYYKNLLLQIINIIKNNIDKNNIDKNNKILYEQVFNKIGKDIFKNTVKTIIEQHNINLNNFIDDIYNGFIKNQILYYNSKTENICYYTIYNFILKNINNFKNINKNVIIEEYSKYVKTILEKIDDIPVELVMNCVNDPKCREKFISNHYESDCLNNLKLALSLLDVSYNKSIGYDIEINDSQLDEYDHYEDIDDKTNIQYNHILNDARDLNRKLYNNYSTQFKYLPTKNNINNKYLDQNYLKKNLNFDYSNNNNNNSKIELKKKMDTTLNNINKYNNIINEHKKFLYDVNNNLKNV